MTRRITRRALIYLAGGVPVAGAAAGLLVACGGAATPTAPPQATATPLVLPTQAPQPAARPAAASPAASPVASPASAAGGAVRDVSFTVVDGSEPNSLDPPVGTGPFQHIVNALYEGLVAWDEKMQAQPALATSWEPSADGKQWTFKLRQGVKFHDGTPFTSDAVKVTIEHLLDKNTLSTRRANYTLIKDIATPAPDTVIFTTDPPNPDFPFLLADGSAKIISPAALQKYGKDFGRNPVGTGPFKFEEWVPNDHVSAVINPDYWGPMPLVRRFVYKPVPEAATRTVVLRTGEADVVMSLSPADQASLQQDQNLAVHVSPSLTVVMVELRESKPPFSVKQVRYALNQAVDKDAIIQKVMHGQGAPLTTPSIEGLYGTADFAPLPFDQAKAKQLLAEGGYPIGFDMTLAYVSGRWAGDDQVVEAVQGYFAQVGVRATIKKLDNAGLDATLSADPDQNPGLAIMPIRTSSYVDYHLYRMYDSVATHANAAQRSGYSNPEVDKLIDQERTLFEPAKRLPVLKQAQQVIWDDQPFVYLFQQTNFWGQRKNVSGFTVLPTKDLVPQRLQKG